MDLHKASVALEPRAVWRIAIAAAGMIAFAICQHHGLPWIVIAALSLTVVGIAIAWQGQRSEVSGDGSGGGPLELLALDRFSASIVLYSIAGTAIGAAFGLLYRRNLGLSLQPAPGVQAFVIVACVIGATEELLYRGWLLGQARAFGWPVAIVIAAVAHAAYKTALFAWPPMPAAVNLGNMMLMTTIGGLVAGLLRKWSGSLLPAMAAHIAFDFVVYRAVAEAPWWVWG